MSTPKRKPSKSSSKGFLKPPPLTRSQRRPYLTRDAIDALRQGDIDEKLEGAAIVRALADISDQHRMTMLSEGVLEVVLASCAPNQDPKVRCAAFMVLSALSSNDSVRQELKRLNGIPQLMGMVSALLEGIRGVDLRVLEESGNPLPGLARAAVHALSVQTSNAQSKVVIREGKGINVLLQAIRAMPTCEEVQLSVSEAMASLAQDPGSRFGIANADGITILCEVIRQRPPSKVLVACLRALTSLSRVAEIVSNFFKKEQIEDLVGCIGGNPDLEKNFWGCQLISNLTVVQSLKTIADQAGVSETLCILLKASAPKARRCTGWAIKALANLSSTDSGKNAFLEAKATRPLVEIFGGISENIYSDDIPACVRLINNIASLESCKVELCRTGTVEILMKLINMRDVHLLKPLLFGLSLLCDHPPTQISLGHDDASLTLITELLSHPPDVCSLAACVLAKCAKSGEGAAAMAKHHVLNVMFQTLRTTEDEKTAAWAANCVTNICANYADQLLDVSPDVLVNIMSILVQPGISIDVTVWLMGALTEFSTIESAVALFVELKGLTLVAQFMSSSNDAQVIEMAAAIFKNIGRRYSMKEEFSVQGVIRPLVHLLGVSLERNDLENSINVVRCMECISVDTQNCQAMRKTGAVPLLVKLLGNQVGCSFVDLESEATMTLTNIGRNDTGSLDILRLAGAIPNLLSMLAVAVYGVNKYHIPRAVSRAVECLTVLADGNEKNRKAVLNSSNFHAIESLRKRDMELDSEAITKELRPLLAALQLPHDWLALSITPAKKKKGKLKKTGTSVSSASSSASNKKKMSLLFADKLESNDDSDADTDDDDMKHSERRWSDGGNILDTVPRHPWQFKPPSSNSSSYDGMINQLGTVVKVCSFPLLLNEDDYEE